MNTKNILFIIVSALSSSCMARDETRACLSGDTLMVDFVNETGQDLHLNGFRPQVGFCAVGGMSLEILNKNGDSYDRCSFLDDFFQGSGDIVKVGQKRVFRYSSESMSETYCGAKLEGSIIVLYHGAESGRVQVARTSVSNSCVKR